MNYISMILTHTWQVHVIKRNKKWQSAMHKWSNDWRYCLLIFTVRCPHEAILINSNLKLLWTLTRGMFAVLSHTTPQQSWGCHTCWHIAVWIANKVKHHAPSLHWGTAVKLATGVAAVLALRVWWHHSRHGEVWLGTRSRIFGRENTKTEENSWEIDLGTCQALITSFSLFCTAVSGPP